MTGTGVVIRFKQAADAGKMAGLDFRLLFLVDLLQLYAASLGYDTLTVTDVDTPGIHMKASAHYRNGALDFRVAPFTPAQLLTFAQWLNKSFDYGGGKRVALYLSEDPSGGHKDHLHLQVPRPHLARGRIVL